MFAELSKITQLTGDRVRLRMPGPHPQASVLSTYQEHFICFHYVIMNCRILEVVCMCEKDRQRQISC